MMRKKGRARDLVSLLSLLSHGEHVVNRPLTTVCIEAGCRNLVAGSGRCSPHQRAHDAARNRKRFWYRDPLYRRNRAILLARARYCELCGRGGLGLTADHVVTVAESLAAGRPPDHSLANLRPLCRSCNSGRRDRVASDASVYRTTRRSR
jgi:5-methylcytosine-specific restriction endonuclease McrA